ncbi:MAG: hypothetical protein HY773_02135 [Candidatus Terrybacteria bacterium]|nr:hypothetical protein [Candidatus Terrybacteria bacterium]
MSHIGNILAKIKNFRNTYEKDFIIVIVIVTMAFISFGLGRLSKIKENKIPITIENIGASATETGLQENTISGAVVASKNGTKYHYPWCSGAQSIKEENKIWFSSIEEARKAGYTPASNCRGLK